MGTFRAPFLNAQCSHWCKPTCKTLACNPADLCNAHRQPRSSSFPRRPFSSFVAPAFCEWMGCLSQSVQWRILGEKGKKKNLYFFVLHSLREGTVNTLKRHFSSFLKKSLRCPSVSPSTTFITSFRLLRQRAKGVSVENGAYNAVPGNSDTRIPAAAGNSAGPLLGSEYRQQDVKDPYSPEWNYFIL